ncbi:MAG: DUF3303 family protein [bacterium]
MLFVTTLNTLPGKTREALEVFLKYAKIPNTINIKESLFLFGKPELLLIFEADNERDAAEFIIQFQEVAETQTSLALPIEKV